MADDEIQLLRPEGSHEVELCPILCNLVPRAFYRFEGDQRSMFEFILVVLNSYTSLINRWYTNAYKRGFKLRQNKKKVR